MADDTPVFLQYKELKAQHPNEVLFFRLGDFYEMFNDDALEVSRLLNLTLTHRGENPMCGIPYHASKIYIARLLRLGKKIAVAEQIGEVAKKGLTERKVVEIITPGTAVESEYLDGGANNFLASAFISKDQVGLAFIDVTTGEFKATHFSAGELEEKFSEETGRMRPREILLPDSFKKNSRIQNLLESMDILTVSYYPDWNFNPELSYAKLVEQFRTVNLSSFSLDKNSPEIPPAGFLLDYIEKTTNSPSPHVKEIEVYKDSHFVIMDDSSRRNLEITSNIRDGSVQYTLLECVNCTKTAMGSRLIRDFLNFPLVDVNLIRKRQGHVEFFFRNQTLMKKLRDCLDGILDIERLAGRIAMDRAHAKDLQALRNSLELWEKAREAVSSGEFAFSENEPSLKIIDLIKNSISEDPPTVFTEGRLIREGWSEELDKWKDIQCNFNSVLENYIEEERARTGIANLRVKSTGNMGYFIEVTKGKLDKVPDHFIMKRTLVNADRYTTERLQELESNLNESSSRIIELEHSLFLEIRDELKNHVPYLQKIAREIAYVDVISAFADSSVSNRWVKPEFCSGKIFQVSAGRHPVVERHIPSGEFVPNDISLCTAEKDSHFALITGPNMAGKSTYLRQNALISLLAQTGCFVPADTARLSVVDRIFCRVGASDNLAKGESTFLVEMTETARILRSATESSLVIMDEVGRGTSTEDGLSIAWAVSEYLLSKIKCKSLFATHYHELTRMDDAGIQKLCMAVNEDGEEIVFLRKVIEGASQNSYGIHVARLAGIPESVISRAEAILDAIQKNAGEESDLRELEKPVFEDEKPKTKAPVSFTGALFSDEEMILDEILSADTDNMTPMQALQLVGRWKSSLSGR